MLPTMKQLIWGYEFSWSVVSSAAFFWGWKFEWSFFFY